MVRRYFWTSRSALEKSLGAGNLKDDARVTAKIRKFEPETEPTGITKIARRIAQI